MKIDMLAQVPMSTLCCHATKNQKIKGGNILEKYDIVDPWQEGLNQAYSVTRTMSLES